MGEGKIEMATRSDKENCRRAAGESPISDVLRLLRSCEFWTPSL
jgi:hypothetical protein